MENVSLTLDAWRERLLNRQDPRVIDYPFVETDPRPVCAIILSYLAFVHFGKKFMKNREAFNVPVWILFIYNVSLVFISAHIVKDIAIGVYQANYNLICQNLSTSTDEGEMRVVNAMWWYYISKAYELLDTFWMVIRKKNNQISFLHVLHHSTMLCLEWIVFVSIPGGQGWFGAFFNSAVHVVMYAYYALSAIPSLRKFLWWKKYLTTFQLVQFVALTTHTVNGIVIGCTFPLWAQYLQSAFCIVMFILFMDFFRQEYIKKVQMAKERKSKKTDNVDMNNNLAAKKAE